MDRVNYEHLTIECFGCDRATLNNAPHVLTALRDAASICNLQVLKEDLHQFSPEGITGYVLLTESHISIHTWPQRGFAVVDVLSCSSVKIDSLIKCFREWLSAKSIDVLAHVQKDAVALN
jgi:S-adenosylmethionine decarboxylase